MPILLACQCLLLRMPPHVNLQAGQHSICLPTDTAALRSKPVFCHRSQMSKPMENVECSLVSALVDGRERVTARRCSGNGGGWSAIAGKEPALQQLPTGSGYPTPCSAPAFAVMAQLGDDGRGIPAAFSSESSFHNFGPFNGLSQLVL